MSIVNGKFLPLSLEDISQAISDLRDAVSAINLSVENPDTSDLDNSVAELSTKLDALQEAFDNFSITSSPEAMQNTIDDLTERVEALEELCASFFGA